MAMTDFLDNVPPNPEGYKPYRPPPMPGGYQPPVLYPPSGNGNGNGNGVPTPPAGQFPPIPDNIFGFFMLMLGL